MTKAKPKLVCPDCGAEMVKKYCWVSESEDSFSIKGHIVFWICKCKPSDCNPVPAFSEKDIVKKVTQPQIKINLSTRIPKNKDVAEAVSRSLERAKKYAY